MLLIRKLRDKEGIALSICKRRFEGLGKLLNQTICRTGKRNRCDSYGIGAFCAPFHLIMQFLMFIQAGRRDSRIIRPFELDSRNLKVILNNKLDAH